MSKQIQHNEWESLVESAKCEQARQEPREKKVNPRLNIIFILTPSFFFLLGFLFPNFFELLAFLVWILGGICSLCILAVYSWTNLLSYKVKEAALSFFLGDLLVFGLILLKPV